MEMHDLIVIGGGIVGVATARAFLQRHPHAKVVVLEKGTKLAGHQTSHNSGVIHAGVYYPPGSLKARLCRRGEEETKRFCSDHDVPFRTTGKLVVATDESEFGRLDDLHERSRVNGLDLEMVDGDALRRLEPNIAGRRALWVKSTGITDYAQVTLAMARDVVHDGGTLVHGARVEAITETGSSVVVRAADHRAWTARRMVACGGVQADRLVRAARLEPDFQILPFRGEYFDLPGNRSGLITRLVYPVPDPALPFLGVHLTAHIDGRISVGPNAVLGLSREGHRHHAVNLGDVARMVTFPGLWHVARTQLRPGLAELRDSEFKRGYLRRVRRYCPQLRARDLGHRHAGIRAQAVRRNGQLIEDFLFTQTDRMLHVCNAPSPAATSAIPIAGMIVDRLEAGATG